MPCCMKYGQQRLVAGRKNYIFFLCPLDGEQFIFDFLLFSYVIVVLTKLAVQYQLVPILKLLYLKNTRGGDVNIVSH